MANPAQDKDKEKGKDKAEPGNYGKKMREKIEERKKKHRIRK